MILPHKLWWSAGRHRRLSTLHHDRRVSWIMLFCWWDIPFCCLLSSWPKHAWIFGKLGTFSFHALEPWSPLHIQAIDAIAGNKQAICAYLLAMPGICFDDVRKLIRMVCFFARVCIECVSQHERPCRGNNCFFVVVIVLRTPRLFVQPSKMSQ